MSVLFLAVSNMFHPLLHSLSMLVPEEAFLLVFSLLLMKRRELLPVNGRNIIKLLLAISIGSIYTGFIHHTTNIGGIPMTLLHIAVLTVAAISVYKFKGTANILKLLAAIFAGCAVSFLVQLLYIPFVVYGTGLTFEKLRDPDLAFTLSLIVRTVQMCIIVFSAVRLYRPGNTGFIKSLFENRLLGRLTLALAAFDLMFTYISGKLIFFDRILLGLPQNAQILVISFVTAFPILNLVSLLVVINYTVNTQLAIKDECRALNMHVNILLKERNYTEVRSQLKDFEENVINL